MSAEFNPEMPRQGDENLREQPTDQPISQSIEQARLVTDMRTQDGSSLPQNQVGLDGQAAAVKHDVVPLKTPEPLQSMMQPAGQMIAQPDQVAYAQSVFQGQQPAAAQQQPTPTELVVPETTTTLQQPVNVMAMAPHQGAIQLLQQQPLQMESAPQTVAPLSQVQQQVEPAPVQPEAQQPQPMQQAQLNCTMAEQQTAAPAAVSAAPVDAMMSQLAPPPTTGVSQNGPPQPATQQAQAPPQAQIAASMAAQPVHQPIQQRTLPPMRTRKNSDDFIYIEIDTYQTAFLNVLLPHGIKLEHEDAVYRQIKRQKEKDKAAASKRLQEERQEKMRQKAEAQQKKRQEADLLRQQKQKEKLERDRLAKIEAEAAAAAKRAEVAKMAEVKMLDDGPKQLQESIASGGENGDGETGGARSSGRPKTIQDYSTIHHGKTTDFSRGAAPPKKLDMKPSVKKDIGSSAKQRGIQVNNQVMKKCLELLKSIKDVCRHPDLMQQITEAQQHVSFINSVNILDTVESNLRDFKFQRAQDMISKIKDAIYNTIKLGQNWPALYPVMTQTINQTNQLIEQSKLNDKSVFSQISQVNARSISHATTADLHMQKQLNAKDKQIRRLQEQVQKIAANKKDKKVAPASKKPETKAMSGTSKAGSNSGNNSQKMSQTGPPAIPPEQKPLTVEERDNLIRQINSLTPQQSEGIIKIVQSFAQKDENNQVTFELTQLPVGLCRQLECYVKKCITTNDKKQKRKEKDALRRVRKREEARQKQQTTTGIVQNPAMQQQIVAAPQQPSSIIATGSQPADASRSGIASAGVAGGQQSQQKLIGMSQNIINMQSGPVPTASTTTVKPPQTAAVSQPTALNTSNFMQATAGPTVLGGATQGQQSYGATNGPTAQAAYPGPINQAALSQSLQQQMHQVTTTQQSQPAQQTNPQQTQQQQNSQNQQVMAGHLSFNPQQQLSQFNQQQQQPSPGQFHPQQQPPQQPQYSTFEQMDNETLLQNMLANPNVRNAISQQRLEQVEKYSLQKQQQQQLTQQQQTQNLQQLYQQQQTQQQQQQQPGQQNNQNHIAQVLQNSLVQQQANQQVQQHLQQQLQQVGIMQQTNQQQAQQQMQQQPLVGQQATTQQTNQMQQNNPQQMVYQQQQQQTKMQIRPSNDDSSSSSSESDDDDNNNGQMQQQRVVMNPGMMMQGQNMMQGTGQGQISNDASDITKVWENISKQ